MADQVEKYAKAPAGASEPHEAPTNAAVTFDTGDVTPEQAAEEVLHHPESEDDIGIQREKKKEDASDGSPSPQASADGRAFEETLRTVLEECVVTSSRRSKADAARR